MVWGGRELSHSLPAPLLSPSCEEDSRSLLLLEWIQRQLDVCFIAIGRTHFSVYFSIELGIVEFSDLNTKLLQQILLYS